MTKQNTNKISTCLWFDGQGEEAANFYVSVFENAKILNTTPYLTDTPSDKPLGSVMTVDFVLEGHHFTVLNGGPLFTLNPSISFFVHCGTEEEVDRLWAALSEDGEALMPLGEYPFNAKYGWIQDKFGLSWQILLAEDEPDQKIVPSLMFSKENTNKAEEAINFYTSVFNDAKTGNLFPYPEDTGPAKKGSLMFGDFMIENTWLAAMDSGTEQDFTFNEAIAIVVNCETQDEIDYYWEKLSAVPESDLPAPRPGSFFVYVIHCNDDSMYKGHTQDLRSCWHKHEAGTAAEHTRRHKPLGIIHFEEYSTREQAIKREKYLKTGFGRKWLKREWKAGRTRQAGQCGWLKDKYGVSWQIVPEG